MTTYYEVIDAEAEHDAFPSVHRFLSYYTTGTPDDEWAYDVEEAARAAERALYSVGQDTKF
jgi:hypothetical protein